MKINKLENNIDILHIVMLCWKNKYILILFTLVSVMLSSLFLFLVEPKYRSSIILSFQNYSILHKFEENMINTFFTIKNFFMMRHYLKNGRV